MKYACMLIAVVAACSDPDELPAPTIASISPEATCFPGRIEAIEIVGENFVDDAEVVLDRVGGGDLITLGGGAVSTFNANLIVALADPGAGAPAALEPPIGFDVVVRNPDGQEARLPAALTKYADVGITSVAPAVGARGSSVAVTITGNGFYGDVEVSFGVGDELLPQWVPATSATTIAMTFDLAGVNSGSYAVSVRNRGGCSRGRDGAFLVE